MSVVSELLSCIFLEAVVCRRVCSVAKVMASSHVSDTQSTY